MHSNSTPWSRRRKIVAAVLGFVLTAAASAAATWFVVTLSGSGQGSYGNASPVTITATANPSTTPCLPGATCDISFQTSNTTGQAQSVSTLTLGTPTGAPAGCTYPPNPFAINAGQLPLSIPTGTQIFHLNVTASSALPACLAGTTFTIPVSGS